MPGVQWRLVTDQILGRLGTRDTSGGLSVPQWLGADTLTGVTIYDGEVPRDVPLIAGDTSGRVAPYLVVRSSIGAPIGETALLDQSTDSVPTYTITCVAGWRADCEQLASTVNDLLLHYSPTVAGHQCGFLVPPPGYSPPVGPDVDVTPVRFYVPLQYQLPVAR